MTTNVCGCAPMPGPSQMSPIQAPLQAGATGAPDAATAAAPAAGRVPWMRVSGASPDEVAKLEGLVNRASASPSARRLFADLQRTGLQVAVRDDATDPEFADPRVGAYHKAGVVYLRRSDFANMVTGQKLLNAFLHEAIHAADTLDQSRLRPAFDEIQRRSGGRMGQEQALTERRALLESRAFVGAEQVMLELGLAAPRPGGFGITGTSLAAMAAKVVQSPGYSTGIQQSFTQGLPDAVLGHALLG